MQETMLRNARVQENIIRKITNTRMQRKEITMDENARKRNKRNSSQGKRNWGLFCLEPWPWVCIKGLRDVTRPQRERKKITVILYRS